MDSQSLHKVGFIGLGNMGNPMARNLIESGFNLVVHDLRLASAENLLTMGASWADSPQAVAVQTDTVITMLPNPAAVEIVVLDEKGLLTGLRPGCTWIDCTTNSQTVFKRLARHLIAKGCNVLDAPVTNAVDAAHRGELIFFIGGETEVLGRVHHIIEVMAAQIFHAGPLGTGIAAKLLTNMLWFVNACAIGEALVLGAKAGIQLTNLWEMIKVSAGSSWVAHHDVPSVFAGHYDPSFTLDLCVKDLGLIYELARDLGVPLAMGNEADEIFHRAKATYGGDKGEMHVVKLLEDITGVSLRVAGYEDFSHVSALRDTSGETN